MAYEKRRKIGLPDNRHKDDEDWIESQLIMISDVNQLTAKTGYSDQYRRVFNSCDTPHRASNLARRTANNNLRKFVKKCIESRIESDIAAPQKEPKELNHDVF